MALPERATRLCAMAASAFTARQALNSFWQEVAELHFPEHADFTTGKNDDGFASNLYDSTPALYRRDFGNYLGSVLRPKGREWFKGRDRDDEVNAQQAIRAHYEHTDKRMRALLYDNKSQFISAQALADHQYVTFGNCVTSAEPRSDRSGMLYRTWHLRDCAWAEDVDGEVDTVYRRFRMKVAHLCAKKKAGWTIPKKITDKLKKSPDDKVQCLHVAMPIDAYYVADRPKSSAKDWVSVYICEDTRDILFEEELNELRYAVSRWFRLSGSAYAISPCAVISTPDARTMQSMTWSIMQAGENAVEPPLVGQSEVVLGPVNLFPGGITWVDKNYDERNGDAIRPVNLGKVPELGVTLHGAMRQQLGDAWYLNKLFLPVGGGEMTAQEVERRWQEFQRATQPIIEPAEPERNGRVLDLTYEVAVNMGWLGQEEDRPDEIDGREFDWTYDNPIEDARRDGLALTFGRAMELTQAAAGADPKIAARFNVTKAYGDTMIAIAPAQWMREEDDPEVEAAQAEITEAVQSQGAIEEAGQMADVVAQAAKAGIR